jgi:hypothetical protein
MVLVRRAPRIHVDCSISRGRERVREAGRGRLSIKGELRRGNKESKEREKGGKVLSIRGSGGGRRREREREREKT